MVFKKGHSLNRKENNPNWKGGFDKKEYFVQYYKKNRDILLAYKKEYYKIYRIKNKEFLNLQRRIYQLEHKEQINAQL